MQTRMVEYTVQMDEFMLYIQQQFGNSKLAALHRKYLMKFGMPETGSSRAVYIGPTYVVKLPLSYFGFRANDWDGSLIDDDDMPLARTRYCVVDGGIPVVFMEKVQWLMTNDIIAKFGHVPNWVLSVDCGQVGLTKHQKLVAFDYGGCA